MNIYLHTSRTRFFYRVLLRMLIKGDDSRSQNRLQHYELSSENDRPYLTTSHDAAPLRTEVNSLNCGDLGSRCANRLQRKVPDVSDT